MPNLYEIHYTEPASPDAEQQKFVIAVDEQDCRDYMGQQEADGVVNSGWTLFDEGVVEGTSGAFPSGPSQLTKAADGRWDETA